MPAKIDTPLDFIVKMGEAEFYVATSEGEDSPYQIKSIFAHCVSSDGQVVLVNAVSAHTEASWGEFCCDICEMIDRELAAEAYQMRVARTQRLKGLNS